MELRGRLARADVYTQGVFGMLPKEDLGSVTSGAGVSTELELELIQTHMTQEPMLRVEVGALDARQAKN